MEPVILTIQWDVESGGCAICRPRGELDAFTVAKFRGALTDTAASPSVLMDMSGVSFIDSAGLGALIGGLRKVRDNGGKVAVACERPSLLRLLRATGFDRVVPLSSSVDEALLGLRRTSLDA